MKALRDVFGDKLVSLGSSNPQLIDVMIAGGGPQIFLDCD
jgi:hypothetical protein